MRTHCERIAFVFLSCVFACGRGETQRGTPAGSGSATSTPTTKPALRALAKLPHAELVAGTNAVGLATDAGWYELHADGPRLDVAVSAELKKLRAAGPVELRLGATPIAIAGEEHHERHVRLGALKNIEIEGHVERITALGTGVEVWQFEERLVDGLAVVDRESHANPLPPHANIGPPVPGMSPVGAKKCATPQIADLASDGDVVAALLVECNVDAPIRIATYRFQDAVKFSTSVEQLRAPSELGFEPQHLLLGRGTRVLVGVVDGQLAIARVTGAKATPTRHLEKVGVVVDAAIDAEGAVWTLTLAAGADGKDLWQVAREGEPVDVRDPAGTPLRPIALGADARHGIVVVAGSERERWILTAR